MSRPYAYRAPGGDIDLEAALGPHLGHYVAVMTSGAAGGRMQVLALGGDETPHGLLVRHGFGLPVRASSRGTVARLPEWSWDVCAYYLLLGVRWTATKREVRLAYVAACARRGGQEQDERLTFAVSQLTDDRARRAYDMVPLGGVFLRDRDTSERLKRAAVAEAVRRMVEEGAEVTAGDVLEEMGLRNAAPPQDDGGKPPQQPPARGWGALWGHYALSGPQGPPVPDTALLEAWQGFVAVALRERGIVTEFAVGTAAEGSPNVLRDSKEACIFLLTGKGASPDKAREAVEMGITLGIVENNAGGF